MRFFSVVWVQLLLLGLTLLLLITASVMSEGVTVIVTPEQDSTVTITKDAGASGCDACVDDGQSLICSLPEFVLSGPVEVSVQFNCSQPQDFYKIKTEMKIECTSDACAPVEGTVQASLFIAFHRSFLWMISGPDGTGLGLDFSGEGLEEVSDSEVCADGSLYTVRTTGAQGAVLTQNYCMGGPLPTQLTLPSKASVSVMVAKQEKVPSTVFSVAPKPKRAKKGRTMAVTPGADTILIFQRAAEGPECSVCSGAGSNPTCTSDLTLREPLNTTIQFTCDKPEDIYNVEINREFDFTDKPNGKQTMLADPSIFPEFDRKFTWDIKAPSRTFQLDFQSPGMKQIGPSESCANQHTYNIITYQRFGVANIGTFCNNGSIDQIQVLYKGRLALSVPKKIKLDLPPILVSVGPETKMLAKIQSKLPHGQSYSDFFSANYLSGFPQDETMQWDFVVPLKHDFTVTFLSHTQPRCVSKAVEVRYEQDGKAPVVKSLNEEQPTGQQGSFRLLLQNCDSGKRPSPPGLTLNFRVSALRGGVPHLCDVKMQEEAGVTLNIEKTNLASYCEMKMDGVLQEKITVLPGGAPKLSFLDCPSEELLLTVTKTLECQSLAECTVKQTPLTIPSIEACLPAPIQSATWHLRVPEQGAVVLQSPTGNLQQSLPGEDCKGNFSLYVAEGDGTPVGQFCSGGAIQQVQVNNNVTITATAASAKNLNDRQPALFNVSYGPEIGESIVYYVRLSDPLAPVLLGTPGWPLGMKPLSTVSWIVSLPSQYRADLFLTNVTQPKCHQDHTMIKVQTFGSEEALFSRREDEADKLADKLAIPGSFYLNMSNCQPESRGFSALSKVMLEKKNKMLLGIILGVLGALLAITLIVLAVVCVVTKKRKKHALANRVSIYNPKGNLFRPPDTFKSDNGSHVYDSIDDAMTYSQLMGDYNGPEPGIYRPFAGTGDVKSPIVELPAENKKKEEFSTFLEPSDPFGPPRPRTPLGPVNSLGFEDRRMVDNELYTFKNPGDPNPIRLSNADPLPPPMVDDDWDDDSYDSDQ